MTDVTFRRFESGDTEAIMALNERAMAAEGTDPDDVPGIDDLHRIESEYIEPGGEFLVAEIEGDIVGMGGLRVDGGTGELFRMRIDPDYQRQGLASRLLDRLERAARQRGAKRLVAETAHRQRAATQFYPANGFEEQDRRSFGEYELTQFEKVL